jgi:glycerol-3-phosphate dehydrogenase
MKMNCRTKGVVMWRSLGNHLLAGPTATDTSSRVPFVLESTAEELVASAKARLLRHGKVVLSYAGLRPGSQQSDYIVAASKDWITVAGIRSTGFSSCLALARHVARLYLGREWVVGPEDSRWSAIPNDFEHKWMKHKPHPQTALRINQKSRL